jgi:hypothetical protein
VRTLVDRPLPGENVRGAVERRDRDAEGGAVLQADVGDVGDLPQSRLVEVREDRRQPTPGVGVLEGVVPDVAVGVVAVAIDREEAESLLVVVNGEGELLEMVAALRGPGRLTCLLNRRQAGGARSGSR